MKKIIHHWRKIIFQRSKRRYFFPALISLIFLLFFTIQTSEIKILQQENKKLKTDVTELSKENNASEQKLKNIVIDKLKQLEEETGLTRIEKVDPTILLDLKYATPDNFTGEQIYPVALGLLQKKTALRLERANMIFKKDGYRIKVLDAYRPFSVQQKLWDLVPDPRYLADPKEGSNHNRGTAVDLTLVDQNGRELAMPTGYDEFSARSARSYQGNSEQVQKNLDYLTDVMRQNGFTTISTEWWHYDDANWQQYPILNVQFEEFVIEP